MFTGLRSYSEPREIEDFFKQLDVTKITLWGYIDPLFIAKIKHAELTVGLNRVAVKRTLGFGVQDSTTFELVDLFLYEYQQMLPEAKYKVDLECKALDFKRSVIGYTSPCLFSYLQNQRLIRSYRCDGMVVGWQYEGARFFLDKNKTEDQPSFFKFRLIQPQVTPKQVMLHLTIEYLPIFNQKTTTCY